MMRGTPGTIRLATHVPEQGRPFHARGIEAAVVGTLDDTGRLAIMSGGRTATVLNLATETVTGLGGEDAARA